MCKPILFLVLMTQFSSFLLAAPQKRQSADISKRTGPIISTETIKLTPEKPDYCLLGGQSGNTFYGEANYTMAVWRNKIIYLGQSDGRQDFTAQIDTLKGMNMARGKKVVVAFAAFNKDIQPLLDEYLAGTISLDDFFSSIAGREDTDYDLNQYRPILEMINSRGLRAIAIGLPASLTRTIEKYGIAGLSDEERALIPNNISRPHNERYDNYIRQQLEKTGETVSQKALKQHIYALAAQNETMAKALADFLLDNPDYSALVITHNDRLVFASGITLSAKNYLSEFPYTTIYIKHAEECPKELPENDRNLCGYIWYIDNDTIEEETEEAIDELLPHPSILEEEKNKPQDL